MRPRSRRGPDPASATACHGVGGAVPAVDLYDPVRLAARVRAAQGRARERGYRAVRRGVHALTSPCMPASPWKASGRSRFTWSPSGGGGQAVGRGVTRSGCRVVRRTSQSSSVADGGRLDGRGQQQHRHVHVRRLGEPALLAGPPERGQREVRGRQRPDGHGLAAADRPAHGPRRLQRDPVRRAAADDDQVAVARTRAAAGSRSACPAAAGARRAPCRAPAALRGRRARAGCRSAAGTSCPGTARAASARSASVRWLTHARPGRHAGRGEPPQPLGDLRVGPVAAVPVHRQVERDPLELYAGAGLGRLGEVAGRETVPAHRGQALDDDPRAAAGAATSRGARRSGPPARSGPRTDAGTTASAPARRRRSARAPRPPRRPCRPRPCRRRARRPPRASRALPKPVAVALDHRHDARGRRRRACCRCARQRGSSTYSVKVIASAPVEVEVEGLVEQPVQRQVPLADVLDGLAAGAELELDQAEVRVVVGRGCR